MQFGTWFVRRLGNTLLVLLGVVTATFFLARLSGDPIDQLVPIGTPVEAREALRRQLGLDAPLPAQYLQFLTSTIQGDFGTSLRYGEPALAMYVQRFPATLELVIAAVLASVVIGIGLGVLAAVNHGRTIDTVVMWFALLGQAVPGFYLGLMMILLFSLQWSLLPTGGRGTWQQLIMPTIMLASYYVALTARMTRSSFLETLNLDFVRTARAKGLPGRTLLFKHVLRAALIPIVTLIGLQIGGLFSGAVVAETIFTWPGIGRLAVDAIYARDFPVVQATVILSATIFVMINLIVDIAYVAIDPRISYG
jgi:peptide/nickel transport system permease protein